MKAVITVTGKDTVGIIASVSALCAEPDYKNRVLFVATAKEPTLRLKLASGMCVLHLLIRLKTLGAKSLMLCRRWRIPCRPRR